LRGSAARMDWYAQQWVGSTAILENSRGSAQMPHKMSQASHTDVMQPKLLCSLEYFRFLTAGIGPGRR
jgi:hypothetical protein